jgi:hypothetical protein
MIEEAVCVFDDGFNSIFVAGFAAANSVVSSIIQIKSPISLLFIFFTPIVCANHSQYYKDISYKYSVIFLGYEVIWF